MLGKSRFRSLLTLLSFVCVLGWGENSGSAGDKPGSARDKPGSARDKPGSARDKPGSARDKQTKQPSKRKARNVRKSPVGAAAIKQLRRLLPPKKKLPAGCRYKPVPKGAKLPHHMKGNPTISAERDFLRSFSRRMGLELPKVHAALFVVYEQNRTEAGLYGFVLTPDYARHLRARAKARGAGGDPRRKVLFVDDMLVMVWADRTRAEACRKALEAHVRGL